MGEPPHRVRLRERTRALTLLTRARARARARARTRARARARARTLTLTLTLVLTLTRSAYENSLILKSFSFQFVNSYTSFFYIAFFRSQRLSFFGLSTTDASGEEVVLTDECSTSAWYG